MRGESAALEFTLARVPLSREVRDCSAPPSVTNYLLAGGQCFEFQISASNVPRLHRGKVLASQMINNAISAESSYFCIVAAFRASVYLLLAHSGRK